MKRIDIVVNSTHGNVSLIRELVKMAVDLSIDLQIHYTQYQGHGVILAENICAQNTSLILAAGGDGTAHEVINGILRSNFNPPPFAIIPVGTGNDFMRGRPFFTCASQIMDSLENKRWKSTDLGCINHGQQKSYFLNIADTGFGGATVHTLNKQRSWIKGKISYSLAILRTFLTFRKPILTISTAEWTHEGHVLLCAFCNGGIFGSGLTIHPEANPHDGELEITLIGKVSLFEYLRYLPKLKNGERIEHSEVKYLRSNNITVKIIDGKSSTEADGEPICETDFTVELVPGKINLLVP
jgi:diacylglycerol kinase (ATP)